MTESGRIVGDASAPMEPSDPAHPAYFDLQVNGYAGVDFNADDLSADELHGACAKLREDGVAGILATVITDAPARMERHSVRKKSS